MSPQQPTEDSATGLNDEPGNDAAYMEYLRGFDEVPVLLDAVRIPPRRSPEPNFRRGERRDVRKDFRPDGYTVRESKLGEIEFLYREYSTHEPASSRPSKAKRKPRPTRKKASTRPKAKAKKR